MQGSTLGDGLSRLLAAGAVAGEDETDLLCGMPCDVLDVLRVLHEDAHAFEVVIGVNWMKTRENADTLERSRIPHSRKKDEHTFPDPHRLIATAAREEVPRSRVGNALALCLVSLQQAHALPLGRRVDRTSLAVSVLLLCPYPDVRVK